MSALGPYDYSAQQQQRSREIERAKAQATFEGQLRQLQQATFSRPAANSPTISTYSTLVEYVADLPTPSLGTVPDPSAMIFISREEQEKMEIEQLNRQCVEAMRGYVPATV